ncbi:30S ribosomal protein S19e [Desulfurococcus mucosus]|uniref:Small ribosomal subunit protein eS19 n=1 Tax=Desulfurococcus mucosus (strain ATCC 35584 / DSM 2162 / JCM 9187 / O7/1) TaxID=765177 RepID=E8RAB6_DESM0|nr:30S ribosomal protein S19e [Desulfurococcus mucosus]ADV65422.1 SSU ribosomal protein S19E [Desulfurococcus mucosus DSM 2162]
MVTALEVPADKLINRLAEYLKENVPEVKPPEWSIFVKTSSHKERPPSNPEWWYYRAASILRKLYKAGRPVGLSELRREYGGRKNRGVRPERTIRAPGGAIRKILQQLEQAQLVRRTRRGRVLTPQGKSMLDRLSFEILVELSRENPELVKYLPPQAAQR